MNTVKSMLRAVRRRWRDEPELRAASARADAFLVSYPKSGRTWLRYLLSCYLADLAELGFRPDLTSTFRVLPNFDRDPVRGIGGFVGNDGRARLPLILVSHLPYNARLFRDRPVVFLVRDPRDVMVSAYYHATRHKNVFSGDVARFLDDSTYGLPAFVRYLNGWGDGLVGRSHLVVSYEAMLAESETTVGAILSFLGIEVRAALLRAAIAAASFDRMRDVEREQGIPGHDYDRSDDQSLRMRSGKAKAFAELLSAAQADAILARCRSDLTPRAKRLLAATDIDLATASNHPPELIVA